MIVVWVFGAPLLVLYILIRNRNNLQEPFMKQYFLLFYQGLRPRAFYWEFVNTLRKILMPLANVLLSLYDPFYRAMVATMILIGLFKLQDFILPYTLEDNNQVEMLAIVSGLMTIYAGVIFIDNSEEKVSFIQLFALFFTIIINTYFIMSWVYLFMKNFKSDNPLFKTLRKLLGYILLKESSFRQSNNDELVAPKAASVKAKKKPQKNNRVSKKKSRRLKRAELNKIEKSSERGLNTNWISEMKRLDLKAVSSKDNDYTPQVTPKNKKSGIKGHQDERRDAVLLPDSAQDNSASVSRNVSMSIDHHSISLVEGNNRYKDFNKEIIKLRKIGKNQMNKEDYLIIGEQLEDSEEVKEPKEETKHYRRVKRDQREDENDIPKFEYVSEFSNILDVSSSKYLE